MNRAAAAPRRLDLAELARALGGGEITGARSRPLPGGLVADTFRVTLTWADPTARPTSVVVKTTSSDPASREAAAASRGYEIECAFYRELAGALPVRVPRAYLVEENADGFLLVLEDLQGARTVDEATGLDADEAALVIDELAGLHAHGLRVPHPAWLDRYQSAGPSPQTWARYAAEFVDRFGPVLPDGVADTVLAFGAGAAGYDYYAQDEPRTICHGDARPDNVFLTADRAVLIDWQTARLADGVAELAYLLGAGLAPQVRRAAEPVLLARYGARTGIDTVRLRERYRTNAFASLARGIRAASTLRRDDRSEETVVRLVIRGARLVLDTAALELLTEGHPGS